GPRAGAEAPRAHAQERTEVPHRLRPRSRLLDGGAEHVPGAGAPAQPVASRHAAESVAPQADDPEPGARHHRYARAAYFLLFETLGPFIEILGYVMVALSFWLGVLNLDFFGLFLI